MVWGGRREEGSGWGTHVYLWQIHFDIWQNQYNIVKLNKITFKKKRKKNIPINTFIFRENWLITEKERDLGKVILYLTLM